jgi:hypothetical protein
MQRQRALLLLRLISKVRCAWGAKEGESAGSAETDTPPDACMLTWHIPLNVESLQTQSPTCVLAACAVAPHILRMLVATCRRPPLPAPEANDEQLVDVDGSGYVRVSLCGRGRIGVWPDH